MSVRVPYYERLKSLRRKGKTSMASLKSQAQKIFLSHYNGLGIAKNSASKPLIHSVNLMNKSIQMVAKVSKELGVKRVNNISVKKASRYFEGLVEQGVVKSHILAQRLAVERALSAIRKTDIKISINNLEKATEKAELAIKSRVYTSKEIAIIAKNQEQHNKLATIVAYYAGLRAKELLTLVKKSDTNRQPSSSRIWSKNRFKGIEGTVFLVTGKGGLTREVIIPNHIAATLEKVKLHQPREVIDRGTKYLQHYDIGGGQSWSQSFSEQSREQLGYSLGGHSVRHMYAQKRIKNNQSRKMNLENAKFIVSQELGHFRPTVTNTYLR